MTVKHTPGPWTIEYRGDNGSRISSQLGIIHGPRGSSDWVCDVGLLHEGDGSGSDANAHLIAAAPELLEALRTVLDASWNGPMPDYARDKARAAIAAAEGKEHQ